MSYTRKPLADKASLQSHDHLKTTLASKHSGQSDERSVPATAHACLSFKFKSTLSQDTKLLRMMYLMCQLYKQVETVKLTWMPLISCMSGPLCNAVQHAVGLRNTTPSWAVRVECMHSFVVYKDMVMCGKQPRLFQRKFNMLCVSCLANTWHARILAAVLQPG